MAKIFTGKILDQVPEGLFGCNMEITRKTFFGGLSAELLINRKFFACDEKDGAPKGWKLSDGEVIREKEESFCGSNFVKLHQGGTLRLAEPAETAPGKKYILKIWARSSGIEPALIEVRTPEETVCLKIPSRPVKGDCDALKAELKGGRCGEFIISCLEGNVWIYEISLLPEQNFYGMREDVIDLLKELRIPYLRFPGGCCADHFDWKEGLKPASERRPMEGADKWFLFRDTFNQDPCDTGINEFAALCREVGAEPEYTVSILRGEPEEAAELVEYCNGGPDTRWGKVRESLGFGPLNIKRWYIGNEIYYFGGSYTQDGKRSAARCDEFAKAMKTADPSIILIGGVCGDFEHDSWDRNFVKNSQTVYDEISFHSYCRVGAENEKGEDEKDLALVSDLYRDGLFPRLEWVKNELFPDNFNKILINTDEWNFTWGEEGSSLMLLANALTLHFFMKSRRRYGIGQARFFHPVNEGMILVKPLEASLDASGILTTYMNLHRGGKLLEVSSDDPDIDSAATVHGEGKKVISIVNRSQVEKEIDIGDIAPFGGRVRLILLESPRCSASERNVTVREEEAADLIKVKPYSVSFIVCEGKKPWIPEREAALCTWKFDYDRGYVGNMSVSLLNDFMCLSERSLGDYASMIKACGFTGIQVMDICAAWRASGSPENVHDKFKILANACHERGLSFTVWVWAAEFSGHGWTDPDVKYVGTDPSKPACEDPETLALFNKYYDIYSETAPYADRVIAHFFDPGNLTDIKSIIFFAELLKEKFRSRNPEIKMAVDTWGCPEGFPEALTEAGLKDVMLMELPFLPLWGVPGKRAEFRKGVKELGCDLGVWGWYTADMEIDQLALMTVNNRVLKDVFGKVREQGDYIMKPSYWSEIDSYHILNFFSLYAAGHLLEDPERDPDGLLFESAVYVAGNPEDAELLMTVLELIRDARSGDSWNTYWWASPGYVLKAPADDKLIRRADEAIKAIGLLIEKPEPQEGNPLPVTRRQLYKLMLPHLYQIRQYAVFRKDLEELEKLKRQGADRETLQKKADSLMPEIPEYNCVTGLWGQPEAREAFIKCREFCEKNGLRAPDRSPTVRFRFKRRIIDRLTVAQRGRNEKVTVNTLFYEGGLAGEKLTAELMEELAEEGVLEKDGTGNYWLAEWENERFDFSI